MASPAHFDDESDLDFGGEFCGRQSGNKRPSPDYDDEDYDNDPFAPKKFCGKVLNCLDIGGEAFALIAGGGSDPLIRIWDPRKPGSFAPVFQFASHTSWVINTTQ